MGNTPSSSAPPAADLTTLLQSWREGRDNAFNDLIKRVYDQLKTIAAARLRQLDRNSTLSPTDLLHETLIGIMPTRMDFQNRAHFFATMSLAIRSILVGHARARVADKRGGGQLRVTFTDAVSSELSMAGDLLAIEQALTQLEALDPRSGQVLHLTYFAGLSQEEIAAVLNISISSVTRDLRFAHGWINDALHSP